MLFCQTREFCARFCIINLFLNIICKSELTTIFIILYLYYYHYYDYILICFCVTQFTVAADTNLEYYTGIHYYKLEGI